MTEVGDACPVCNDGMLTEGAPLSEGSELRELICEWCGAAISQDEDPPEAEQ